MVVRPRLAVTPLITVIQGVVLWCMIYLHAERADYGCTEKGMRNVRVAVVVSRT